VPLLVLLALALALALTSSSQTASAHPVPPHVRVVAKSHYELGADMGKQTASLLQDFLRQFARLRDTLMPFYKTSHGRAFVHSLRDASFAAYPQYADELRGLSAGSGVDVATLLVLNFKSEISGYLAAAAAATATATATATPFAFDKECSDVLLSTRDGNTFADLHNEDGSAALLNTSFLLSAAIVGGTTNFTAYVYPGFLPGMAHGWNAHGLSVCINALFEKAYNGAGIGKYFMTRALLDARSASEARAILSQSNRAYGFSANIGCFDAAQGLSLFNAEVSVQEVVYTEVPRGGSHTYHFNNYLHSGAAVPHWTDKSSSERLKRALAMPVPTNITGMRAILGDTQNTQYPIYRDGAAPDLGDVTVSTGLYDLRNRVFALWVTNPKTTAPALTRPMSLQ
jgi:hypothetical protein